MDTVMAKDIPVLIASILEDEIVPSVQHRQLYAKIAKCKLSEANVGIEQMSGHVLIQMDGKGPGYHCSVQISQHKRVVSTFLQQAEIVKNKRE